MKKLRQGRDDDSLNAIHLLYIREKENEWCCPSVAGLPTRIIYSQHGIFFLSLLPPEAAYTL